MRKKLFSHLLPCFFLLVFTGFSDTDYLEDLQRLAQKGDPEAQLAYAIALDTTPEGIQKKDKVIELYMAAAKQGLPLACLYLGMKYEFGNGVAQNTEEAIHWYRKGAESNLPTAQHLLGSLYLEKEDTVSAFAWLSLAAESQHPGSNELLNRAKSLLSGTDQKSQAHQLLDHLRKRILP